MQGATDNLGTMEEPAPAVQPPVYRVMIMRGDDVVATLPLPDGIADDRQAKTIAQAMVSSCAVELWQGLRYVERFDGGDGVGAFANAAW